MNPTLEEPREYSPNIGIYDGYRGDIKYRYVYVGGSSKRANITGDIVMVSDIYGEYRIEILQKTGPSVRMVENLQVIWSNVPEYPLVYFEYLCCNFEILANKTIKTIHRSVKHKTRIFSTPKFLSNKRGSTIKSR